MNLYHIKIIFIHICHPYITTSKGIFDLKNKFEQSYIFSILVRYCYIIYIYKITDSLSVHILHMYHSFTHQAY